MKTNNNNNTTNSKNQPKDPVIIDSNVAFPSAKNFTSQQKAIMDGLEFNDIRVFVKSKLGYFWRWRRWKQTFATSNNEFWAKINVGL